MAVRDEDRSLVLSIPSVSDFIGSVWAKILAILAAVSIVVGIAIEIQNLMIGYQNLRKATYDADITEINAHFAKESGKYP